MMPIALDSAFVAFSIQRFAPASAFGSGAHSGSRTPRSEVTGVAQAGRRLFFRLHCVTIPNTPCTGSLLAVRYRQRRQDHEGPSHAKVARGGVCALYDPRRGDARHRCLEWNAASGRCAVRGFPVAL
jgi:hypothetical protein